MSTSVNGFIAEDMVAERASEAYSMAEDVVAAGDSEAYFERIFWVTGLMSTARPNRTHKSLEMRDFMKL